MIVPTPKRSTVGGRRYRSIAEGDYAAELALLERAGAVSDVEYEPRIELEPRVFYKPDFAFTERGVRVWVEVKHGRYQGDRFALVCMLWKLHGPGPLRVVKAGHRRRTGMRLFRTVREIIPRPAPGVGVVGVG